MLHRARALLIRQQTMLANAFRAHLAELGIVVPQGIRHVRALVESVFGKDAIDLPALARTALRPLVAQLMELRLQIKTIEKELLAWHRTSQESRRLETIPGVGFITATAIAATVTDPSHFRSSREFSAWLGLTPRQTSSGGKDRLGRVSKMGNGYVRSLIVSKPFVRSIRLPGRVRSERPMDPLLERWPARFGWSPRRRDAARRNRFRVQSCRSGFRYPDRRRGQSTCNKYCGSLPYRWIVTFDIDLEER